MASSDFAAYKADIDLLAKQNMAHVDENFLLPEISAKLDSVVAAIDDTIDGKLDDQEQRLVDLQVDRESIDVAEDSATCHQALFNDTVVDVAAAQQEFLDREKRVDDGDAVIPDAFSRPGGRMLVDAQLRQAMQASGVPPAKMLAGWQALIQKVAFTAGFTYLQQQKVAWLVALMVGTVKVPGVGAHVKFVSLDLGIHSPSDVPGIDMADVQPEEPFTYAIDLDVQLDKFELEIEVHALGMVIPIIVSDLYVSGSLRVRILPEYIAGPKAFIAAWFDDEPDLDFDFRIAKRFTGKVNSKVHEVALEQISKALKQKVVAPQRVLVPFWVPPQVLVKATQAALHKIRSDPGGGDQFQSLLAITRRVETQYLCLLSELKNETVVATQKLAKYKAELGGGSATNPIRVASLLTLLAAAAPLLVAF